MLDAMIDTSKVQIKPADVDKILNWLKNRGGVFVWEYAVIGCRPERLNSPATTEDGKPHQKPNWRFADTPKEHITDIDKFEVVIDRPVKAFKVGVRMNWQTGACTVTDAATRRIDAEVFKAGPGAYHAFDHTAEKNCTVFVPSSVSPLAEYIAEYIAKTRKL